jgi:hypothetical protein
MCCTNEELKHEVNVLNTSYTVCPSGIRTHDQNAQFSASRDDITRVCMPLGQMCCIVCNYENSNLAAICFFDLLDKTIMSKPRDNYFKYPVKILVYDGDYLHFRQLVAVSVDSVSTLIKSCR